MVVNNHQLNGFISNAMKQPIRYINALAISIGNRIIQVTSSIALIRFITFFYKDIIINPLIQTKCVIFLGEIVIFIYIKYIMRRFDKKTNVLKANILAEQKRLREIGYLCEIEDTDMAYNFLTEDEQLKFDFADQDVDDEIHSSDDEKSKTNATFFKVRFNLAKTGDQDTGKNIFMTWKIEPNGKTAQLGDDKLNFKPDEVANEVSTGGVRNNFNVNEFNMKFSGCSLVNRANSGYEIKCFASKFPFAYLKCSDIEVNRGAGSPGSPDSQIIYNPRVAPYWVMMGSTELFELATNEPIKIGEQKMEIRKFESGLVYESCVSVQKGEDDKMPPTKYYYIQNGGEAFIKVVEPSVTSYKSSGRIYKVIDGMSFSKAYTSGNKIYLG